MKLDRQVKVALDESRLLMLGAQVLFGFQFSGIFQELFVELPRLAQHLSGLGLPLLMLAIGLLIAPSMQHRLVERGTDSPRLLAAATLLTSWALLPFSIALALDIAIALQRIAGTAWGIAAGATFFMLAIVSLYVLEFLLKKQEPRMPSQPENPTSLTNQVEQLLTEARVIIPGAQAMLGFQLTVVFTRAFQELETVSKAAHAIALCSVACSILLLMAPASLHRISFAGQDSRQFMRIASRFVIAAPLPLAIAIALDTYVAAGRAFGSQTIAAGLAVLAILALLGLWYAYPIARRIPWNGGSENSGAGRMGKAEKP
jgi:hypothetical protein